MASGDGGNRHRTWNIQHSRRLAQYNARLERILRQAVTRAASSVTRRNATATADTPFTFKADRVLDSEIDSLMKDLAAEITAVTGGAERTEWDKAQTQAVRYLTDLYDVAEQSKGRQDAFNDTMLTMRSRNLDALDEFRKRKIGGMTLSEKVWDCTADFKGQMECAIDTALLEGKSAASLAQSVQGLLDNPDALFRRVRDAGGTLRLSKAAKAFHPGKGKYRSAHKNAMRLARTEINMAYRASDCNVAQMLDCVVGIRVNLSNNHNCEGVPTGQFTDICDQLAGDYPKDFKFTGWHPQCRCFITYINKTDEEFWRDLENGENNASVNTVNDVPDAFKQWVSDNSDRLNKAEAKGSVPYFIKDNKQTVERIRDKKDKDEVEYNGLPGVFKKVFGSSDSDLAKSKLPDNLSDKERKAIESNNNEIEKALGIKKGEPKSVEEADMQSANPKYNEKPEYSKNCQTCVPAYMLRLRGFDITAKGNTAGSLNEYVSRKGRIFDLWENTDGSKAKPILCKKWLKKKRYDKMTRDRYLDFYEECCKEEGVYIVSISWDDSYSHAAILQRFSDGSLKYIETMCYNGQTLHDLTEFIEDAVTTPAKYQGIMRIDNKLFNLNFLSLFEKTS